MLFEFPVLSKPNGAGLIIMGGMTKLWEPLSRILELECGQLSLSDCAWKASHQELKYIRNAHVALWIPEHFEMCSN